MDASTGEFFLGEVRRDTLAFFSVPAWFGCVCVLGSRFLPDVFRRTTFLLSGHDPPFVRCSRGRWKGIKAPHFVLTGRGLGVCRNGTPKPLQDHPAAPKNPPTLQPRILVLLDDNNESKDTGHYHCTGCFSPCPHGWGTIGFGEVISF